jgi:uncharacterized protein YbaR (Trm112 family)
MIDEKLLEILVCPACEDRPKVRLEGNILYCEKCRREYPVENSMPVMLPEKAVIREER